MSPSDAAPRGSRRPYRLFDVFGVEIEYMIVDADTLSVRPICDQLMEAMAGAPESEIERGPISWSNELTLHVLELKTNGPAASLAGLAGAFHEGVREANERLAGFGARLMPGAMHAWMDPATETRLWPHEYTDVYRAFDRIFGTSGHGWANLQATHLNLPFAGDDEFGRLHAAIRLVLPLIPALAAASPFLGGARGPGLDSRLVMYRGNARRVPSVSGSVVPEPAFSREEYERDVLGRIYADLAPLDPEGVLRHEWVNARGAIARFDRGAIEVRVIDAQECPSADLAVVAAVTEVVRALAEGPLAARDPRGDPTTESLACLLEATTLRGDAASIEDDAYLNVLGMGAGAGSAGAGRPTAGELWRHLLDRFPPADPQGEWTAALETMLSRGPLARRMLEFAGELDPPGERRGACSLRSLYAELCDCLERNQPFRP